MESPTGESDLMGGKVVVITAAHLASGGASPSFFSKSSYWYQGVFELSPLSLIRN